MKKYLIMLAILIAIILTNILPTSGAMADDAPLVEYMHADSVYFVFSQEGQILSLDIDLHTIPLIHIPYYLPRGSRCVIGRIHYELYGKVIDRLVVIYAIGEGQHILPPLYPATPL